MKNCVKQNSNKINIFSETNRRKKNIYIYINIESFFSFKILTSLLLICCMLCVIFFYLFRVLFIPASNELSHIHKHSHRRSRIHDKTITRLYSDFSFPAKLWTFGDYRLNSLDGLHRIVYKYVFFYKFICLVVVVVAVVVFVVVVGFNEFITLN